jgi:hypothetical protein
MDGDRAHAEFAAGTQNPQRDLPAIGYQDFAEHD